MDKKHSADEIYQEFLDKLELLRKEQDALIREYREKLESVKVAQLKEELSA